MKLKELHRDIVRYLQEECYCPGEIYSSDGFFFEIFESEDEVINLGSGKNTTYGNMCACIAVEQKQILLFALNEDETVIIDAIRCDATDENIELVKNFLEDKTTILRFNSFNPEQEAKALKQLLSISNIVMYD